MHFSFSDGQGRVLINTQWQAQSSQHEMLLWPDHCHCWWFSWPFTRFTGLGTRHLPSGYIFVSVLRPHHQPIIAINEPSFSNPIIQRWWGDLASVHSVAIAKQIWSKVYQFAEDLLQRNCLKNLQRVAELDFSFDLITQKIAVGGDFAEFNSIWKYFHPLNLLEEKIKYDKIINLSKDSY